MFLDGGIKAENPKGFERGGVKLKPLVLTLKPPERPAFTWQFHCRPSSPDVFGVTFVQRAPVKGRWLRWAQDAGACFWVTALLQNFPGFVVGFFPLPSLYHVPDPFSGPGKCSSRFSSVYHCSKADD